MGDTDLCIDHVQHTTEAEDNVEEMDAFEEDGALLITVVMQMPPFRDDFLSAPLDNRVFCSCGMHIYWRLWLCVTRRCSITIMTKDKLGYISVAVKMEHGGEPQRLRKMLS